MICVVSTCRELEMEPGPNGGNGVTSKATTKPHVSPDILSLYVHGTTRSRGSGVVVKSDHPLDTERHAAGDVYFGRIVADRQCTAAIISKRGNCTVWRPAAVRCRCMPVVAVSCAPPKVSIAVNLIGTRMRVNAGYYTPVIL